MLSPQNFYTSEQQNLQTVALV